MSDTEDEVPGLWQRMRSTGHMVTDTPYQPGEDEMWDRLGSDWHSIDYQRGESTVLPRLYVRWSSEAGRTHISGLCIAGTVTTDVLRSIPVSFLENLGSLRALGEGAGEDTPAAPPLRRVKGEDPEEFVERVAAQYRIFAARSSSPAKDMADHAGVPVGTVRGWIREARLRGKLPPGRQGRAG